MSSLFDSVLTNGFSAGTYLVCLLCAGLCGLIAALAVSRRSQATRSFFLSLVVLPVIVATVIFMVNGNVGTGIAVAGAFSLVRFRSAAGSARDITAIFLVMTAGLACAAGYVAVALLFTLLCAGLIVLLSLVPLRCDRQMTLHVTVPESLHFADAFNDLFERYAREWKLTKVRTSNMGSLYKLDYSIEMKDAAFAQEFLDALRCRNGNLEVALMESAEKGEAL